MLTPPAERIAQFENSIAPAFQQVACLIAKNTNLHRTRELLLPKLIAGEVIADRMESPSNAH